MNFIANKVMMTNPKDEIGAKKVNLDLVPDSAISYAAIALTEGARKYNAYNWRDNSVQANIYVAAARRHLSQWWNGEELDSESGGHHLGAALASLMILVDSLEGGNLIDNRPPKQEISKTMQKLIKQYNSAPKENKKK